MSISWEVGTSRGYPPLSCAAGEEEEEGVHAGPDQFATITTRVFDGEGVGVRVGTTLVPVSGIRYLKMRQGFFSFSLVG